MQREDFSGTTVLVTGASRNIGRAIALAFGSLGFNVAVNARSSGEDALAVAAEIESLGGQAGVFLGDVGNPTDCERVVSEVADQFGPVDYLVSNASRRRFQAFLEITPEDWDATLRSNLSALFYLSRLVLPGMAERRFGRIVSIGGPDGYIGWHHRAHNVTAKSGLPGLVKAISWEFGAKGVTANIVVPGDTDTTRDPVDYPEDLLSPEGMPQGMPPILVPRKGTVEELADAVLFLASDRASYITGQALQVNGGAIMR